MTSCVRNCPVATRSAPRTKACSDDDAVDIFNGQACILQRKLPRLIDHLLQRAIPRGDDRPDGTANYAGLVAQAHAASPLSMNSLRTTGEAAWACATRDRKSTRLNS